MPAHTSSSARIDSARRSCVPPRLTALSAAMLIAFGTPCSWALPTGEQIVAGSVTVQSAATTMTIKQGSDRGIVNWRTFDIATGERVLVQQPSVSSVLLNRVIGGAASSIHGQLSSNGQVFLVNPAGITFGRTAAVDVGGLVASTLQLSDEDFLAGRYRFDAGQGFGFVRVDPGAAIRVNEGTRGFVALLGGEVSNQGLIAARLGTVALAGSDAVTLDVAGDGLIKLKLERATFEPLVQNSGTISADGGQVILTAAAFLEGARTVINHSGTIQAQSLVEREGRIVLESVAQGGVAVSGIDVSAKAEVKGGEVRIAGESVALLGANLETGNGNVVIEGRGVPGAVTIAASSITTTGGDVWIRGGSSATPIGVRIGSEFLADAQSGPGARVLVHSSIGTGSGNVLIDGRAGLVGAEALGVLIESATVRSVRGDIDVIGEVAQSDNLQAGVIGVQLLGVSRSTELLADSGAIRIDGRATGAQLVGLSVGIDAVSSTVSAGRAATLIGLAGPAAPDSFGVRVRASLPKGAAAPIGSVVRSGGGAVRIDGTAGVTARGTSVGVQVIGSEITTTAGPVDVRGVAQTGTFDSGFDRGVELTSLEPAPAFLLSAARIGAAAQPVLLAGQTRVAASAGQIRISGDSPRGAAIQLNGAQIGGPGQSGDIVLAASAGTFFDGAVRATPGTSVETSGVVNIRTGSLSSDPSFRSAPIAYVAVEQTVEKAMSINGRLLDAITGAPAALIIGTDSYAGQIRIDAPLAWNRSPLTLQTTGSGSAGIHIAQPLSVSANLALASAGPVTQDASGPITAYRLALRGFSPGASFDLGNAKNRVFNVTGGPLPNAADTTGRVAAWSEGGFVRYMNDGTVDLSPVTWAGFSTASERVVRESIGVPVDGAAVDRTVDTFGAPDGFYVTARGGNLLLDPPIQTTARGSVIELISDGVFQNYANGSLNPGPQGRWLVASRSWQTAPDTVEIRGRVTPGNPLPNVFGCRAGQSCVPSSGNHFLYQDQPVAVVEIGSATRPVGDPNPVIPVSISGRLARLGDSPGDVARGRLSTEATSLSNVGTYEVTGEFSSPANYRLTVRPGTLEVTPRSQQPELFTVPHDSPLGNLILPRVCAAAGGVSVAYSEANGGDALDQEWSKVRQRLMLSTCTGVRLREACSDF